MSSPSYVSSPSSLTARSMELDDDYNLDKAMKYLSVSRIEEAEHKSLLERTSVSLKQSMLQEAASLQRILDQLSSSADRQETSNNRRVAERSVIAHESPSDLYATDVARSTSPMLLRAKAGQNIEQSLTEFTPGESRFVFSKPTNFEFAASTPTKSADMSIYEQDISYSSIRARTVYDSSDLTRSRGADGSSPTALNSTDQNYQLYQSIPAWQCRERLLPSCNLADNKRERSTRERSLPPPPAETIAAPITVEKLIIKEVPVDRIVERAVEVTVPVEKIINKVTIIEVPTAVEVMVDRFVPQYVEVPVEKNIEKVVIKEVPIYIEREVPVDRVVQRIVEVPVEVIKEVEQIRIQEVPVYIETKVPVDKIVEKRIEFPIEIPMEIEKVVQRDVPIYIDVEHLVDRVVEKIVEIPVEMRVEVPIEKLVEVPVERKVDFPVERLVEVPIDRTIEIPVDRLVEKIVTRDVPVYIKQDVERVVERLVEVPVERLIEKVVYREPDPPPIQYEPVYEKRQKVIQVPAMVMQEQIIEEQVQVGIQPKGTQTPRTLSGPRIVGVGLALERGLRDGATYVERIIPGFAADQSGQFRVGDVVRAIDGTEVTGAVPLDEIKRLTIGPEGSAVVVEVERGGEAWRVQLVRKVPPYTDETNAEAASLIIEDPGRPGRRASLWSQGSK